MKICCRMLTTCGVEPDGEVVRLGLVDDLGKDVTLCLSFEQAEAIAMTLPELLTGALARLTGSRARGCELVLTRAREGAALMLALAARAKLVPGIKVE